MVTEQQVIKLFSIVYNPSIVGILYKHYGIVLIDEDSTFVETISEETFDQVCEFIDSLTKQDEV